MKRKDNQQHIGDLIKAYMKLNKLDDKLEEVDLRNAWEEIMGTPVARHTSKLELRNKVLVIRLDSSVLRQELSMGKDKIKEAINAHFGREVAVEVLLS